MRARDNLSASALLAASPGMWSICLVYLAVSVALAGDAAVPPVSGVTSATVPDVAEYRRLSQELEKLITRNAWAGVERTYLALVATGVPPSFEDHLAGAHSARAIGDVLDARNRLIAANEIREDHAVVDWLWDIDSNYNRVFLACDVGARTLEPGEMPFDPNQRRAVEFAQNELATTGIFDGYLPSGQYAFGDSKVTIEPRVQSVSIDVRTEEGIRNAERKQKKEEKKDDKSSSSP
jgi:hypothetical protein